MTKKTIDKKEQNRLRREYKKTVVTRAISLPVVKPLNGTWDEFRAELDRTFGDVRRVSNHTSARFFATDLEALSEDGRIAAHPPMPDLYAEAKQLAPGLATRTLSTIQNEVQKKCYAARRRVLDGLDRYPQFTNPRYPIPIHAEQWAPGFEEQEGGGRGWPVVKVRIRSTAEPDSRRWDLLLKGGAGFRRQMETFRALAERREGWKQCAAYLIAQPCEGRNRDGTKLQYKTKLGRSVPHVLMLKMVFDRPKAQPDTRMTETLIVRTAPDKFLASRVMGRDRNEWTVYGEHARRWIAEHRRRMAALANDRKYEERAKRPGNLRRGEAWCEKHRNRIATFIKQTAAALVGYALRRQCGTIVWDDSCRDYLESFEWAAMLTAIKNKAAEPEACGLRVLTVGEYRLESNEMKADEAMLKLKEVLDQMLKETRDDHD